MNAWLTGLGRRRPSRRTLFVGAAVVYVQAMLSAGYALFAPVTITDPLVLIYPWLWIDVAFAAVLLMSIPAVPARRRRVGIAVGLAYFGLLAAVGGLVSPGHAFHGHLHDFGWRLAWPLPPGWGPMPIYAGEWIGLALVPYKVVGYAALAYLVAATVVDAVGSPLAGVVGLFSCVSCTWPVVGTVLTSVFGSTSIVAATAMARPYGTSTVVFLSAIGLLLYRPAIGSAVPGR